MEEVDKIIIKTLCSLGCNFDEYRNLSQFGLKELVRGIVTCVQVIDKNFDMSPVLPINMSQRFRVAASLAEKIKDIGYSTDFGYQSILYPNEVEIRKLFVYLIEKLPKESPLSTYVPVSRSVLLQQEVKKKLQNALSRPWIPSYCRQVARKSFQSELIPSVTEYGILHCWGITCANIPVIFHANSLNARCTLVKNKMDSCKLVAMLNMKECHMNASDLKTTELEPLSVEIVDDSIKEEKVAVSTYQSSSDLEETKLENDLTKIQVEISHVRSELQSEYNKLNSLEELIKQVEKDKQNVIQRNKELEDDLANRRMTHNLLPEADTNISKLKAALKKHEDKMIRLQNQWELHRVPLEKSFNELNERLKLAKEEKNKIELEIQEMKEKSASLSIEASNKEALTIQLKRQYANKEYEANRNVYTKRILDISGKINKQKLEIDKVLKDTKDIQKEINFLNGKIDRAFAVAENLAYKEASKSQKARPIYRRVIEINKGCTDLIEVIRETGIIQKDIIDLEEQLDLEKIKKLEVHFEQVKADLSQVRKENEKLKMVLGKS